MGKMAAKPGLKVIDLVTSDHGSKDLWQGRAQVFVKAPRKAGHALILHEFLAARLANSLGIPVPFGEVSDVMNGREAWTSAVAGRTGKFYGPPDLSEVYSKEPHIMAGVAVFDVWIYNPDRVSENLVWHPNIGLWAIDHEGAFLGEHRSDPAELKELADQGFLYPGRKAIPFKPEDCSAWTKLISRQGAAIAAHALDICHTRALLTLDAKAHYLSFLERRAQNIAKLVEYSLELRAHPESFPLPGGAYTEPLH